MRKLLEKFLVVSDDELPEEPVDVIIGIGAGLSRAYSASWKSTTLSLQSEKVLYLVLKFFKKGLGKKVFFSGGYSYRRQYESFVMRDKFLDFMRKKTRIFYPAYEIESKDSFGNALQILEWMERNRYKSAIIVAFAGNLKQIKQIFLKQAKGTKVRFYFINAHAVYGGNSQIRLNNFYLFLVWEILTNARYKLIGAL